MEFEYKIITRSSLGILSDEQFFALCQENRDLQFERTSQGDIIVMPPTGGETGFINSGIIGELYYWNKKKRRGIVFDSSTGFYLPNGAMRSPDVAWIQIERWNALTKEEKKKFPPLCPDFIVELKSESDPLKALQDKMTEWIANGCRLAWLINPETNFVYIYRPGKEVAIISSFDETLSGEEVLPGFTFNLNIIK